MSVSGVAQGASYLQYLVKPQPAGQPTQPTADHDHDGDTDVAGATDHDSGHKVDIKA